MAWTKLVTDKFGGFLYISYSFNINESARTWSCSAALKIEIPGYMAYGPWDNTSAHTGTLQANGMAYLNNLNKSSATDFTLVESKTVKSGNYPLSGQAPSVSVSWAFNANSPWAGYVNESGTVTLTGTAIDPATHTVHFCATDSNTEVAGHLTKTYGQPLYVPTYSDGQFAFGGWKSNSAIGTFPASTIYTATSATSGGVEYTYDQNGGDIYLHWVPGAALGPSIILDANIYFNTDNNYLFSGTGATASWTKFTSNAKYNDPPYEYQTEAKTYTPNSNHPSFSIRGTPYTHAGKFGVEFCGYYTKKDWTDPGIQVYVPKFDWLYGDNRNYATVAVPNTEYFGSLQSFDDWTSDSTINFYTAADSYYAAGDDILEQISSDSLYVPKIDSKVTSPPTEGLPIWLKTGSDTYTFYALWSKPNLKFTYYQDSETGPSYEQSIGTPGPASETGKVQSFTIKSFDETGLTLPIGYKFIGWNTESNKSDGIIEAQTLIELGGYLNDVALYAQYQQYQHTINIYGIENTTFTKEVRGGEEVPLPSAVINSEDPDNPTLKFAGVFDANGVMVFNKKGTAVNGNYFTNGLWDYRSDDTSLNLYIRWAPPTNAYINDNETWKPALIYINKNSSNPSLEPDWELVDMAEFLNNN